MPVSTFSASSSSIRSNSGHEGMIARWSSTRDRLREDERRMSRDEITEMDGTGLHERGNWPLPDTAGRSISPDTVISVRSGETPQSPTLGDGDAMEDAMLRKSEDIPQEPGAFLDDKSMSDVSEVEGTTYNDSEEGTYWRDEESRGSSTIVPATEEPSDISSERGDASDQPEYAHTDVESEIVSEQRERRRSGLRTTWRDEPPDISLMRDINNADSTDGADEPGSSDVEENEHTELHEEREVHRNGQSETAYHNEERDVATPIPFGLDGTYDASPPSQSSPPAYGRSPNMTAHVRQSSLFKGTPPSRNSSRRSTHLPSTRDRVRYSWQSFQDEEPNRPRIHIIKLVSNTATASAGFPQGEALGFSLSPRGKRLAAYNSAVLYILQTAALPVGVSQDFALKRRPLAVEVVDEGNVLAILADEHTINIYDLAHQQLRRIRTIKTDFPTTSIALSPTGGLLAAAYEGGVEIFSLSPSALPTDRRAVRCPRMDRLMFSDDSSTLLGTTTRINVSSTMAVSVPVFPTSGSGIPSHEELKEAWCSDLLHPENIRNSSHATFMRDKRETSNERLFAWNGLEDVFGVLNVNDMEYGNVEFPIVISPPLSTCGGLGAAVHSCPAIDERGDTVAMIVNDRTIRLYIIPRRVNGDQPTVEAHSIDHELDEGYGCPFSEVRWVYSSTSLPAPLNSQTGVQGRLVVTSPGGVVDPTMNEDSVEDIEGGRIILFDFDPQFAGQPGQTFSLTLGKSQAQLLEEPEIDVAEEVALVRKRTVNLSKGGGLSTRPITLGRAASTFSRRDERSLRAGSPNLVARAGSRASVLSMQSEASRSLPDSLESSESADDFATFEEPYAQNAPRSQAALQRAASNAQRHRFQKLEERTQERVSVESSGNFLPLPEYTEEPNAPLPSRFRVMAGLDGPSAAPPVKPAIITSANGDRISPVSSGPSTAPAAVAENFSPEQAFAAASMRMQSQRAGTAQSPSASSSSGQGIGTVARSGTFDSVSSMPRSLQRAYGHAASPPPGTGPAPSLIGDWENVSPIISPNQVRQPPQPSQVSNLRSGTLSPPAETLPEEEAWDAISSEPPTSYFGRSAMGSQSYRHSTSLLNPPGHPSPTRAQSSASSFEPPSSPTSSSLSSRTRRIPPHMRTFRDAAATNASASLFPTRHSADHVPIREPPANAGTVGHPVVAWHPPAPSIASAQPGRGHSRKSSLSNKSAFASTARAKKLGFFRSGSKKRRNQQLFASELTPSGPPRSRGAAESTMETKSVFTMMTSREGKCTLM
ncbi:hypothetical protein LTR37_000115 [Vermiconidia calcicola]|uniref:Uncharacterized protein n=1 Tax=Vermiconidia calcicola TaxID=1690605 RepID=A0ACC3NZ53_9PEZI|nr:hypothetical protein LTR37_000115 [Vermiconidia calcicola]